MMMRVRATAPGFYERLRTVSDDPDDVFMVPDNLFSEKWMEVFGAADESPAGDDLDDLSDDDLRARHEGVLGKAAHPMAKRETIIAKLREAAE